MTNNYMNNNKYHSIGMVNAMTRESCVISNYTG